MTLQGTSGALFELAFPSFESFLGIFPENQFLLNITGDITTSKGLKKAKDLYTKTSLLPGRQVLLVPHADQAMTCYGDSGGPLLKKVGNRLTIFGVTSWGLSSKNSACGYLAVEATLGKHDSSTWVFAEQARDYIPCESERIRGRCDGTRLIRCSAPGEGLGRALKHDCAEEGLACTMVPATIPFGGEGSGSVLDDGVRAECTAK